MSKKKVEVEIDLPECGICGGDIEIGEQYISLHIVANRYTKHVFSASGKNMGDIEIDICKKCATDRKDISLNDIRDKLRTMLEHADWYK